jgi:hypothetical protein
MREANHVGSYILGLRSGLQLASPSESIRPWHLTYAVIDKPTANIARLNVMGKGPFCLDMVTTMPHVTFAEAVPGLLGRTYWRNRMHTRSLVLVVVHEVHPLAIGPSETPTVRMWPT